MADAESPRVPPGEVAPTAGPESPRPSHLTADRAESRMVDVSPKAPSARSATARARVRFPAGVLERVLAGTAPKGPFTEVARVAGILAAKRTGELVPMCHPLALDHVEVHFERLAADLLEVRARAACTGRTGVEMEALVAASIAALTVYDMAKALGPGIQIEAVELLEKTGGRSGRWVRGEAGPAGG